MTNLILFAVGAIGAWSTFVVSHNLKQGAVRASAGLSLIVALFFYVFPDLIDAKLSIEIPLVFFGASFVGMTGSHLVPQQLLIALGGILFSGIYLSSGILFDGYGGKLGTSACIASVLVVALQLLLKPRQSQ